MELQQNYSKIQESQAELIAISAENVALTEQTVKNNELTYLVLSDNKKAVINAYNVLDQTNLILARPAAFIIIPDGTIVWKSLDKADARVPTTTILTELGKLR